MLAAMAVASSSAFAQADVVKSAKKLFDKGEFAQAIEAVKPALEAGTSEEKASAWNLLSQIYFKQYSDQSEIAIKSALPTSKEKADSVAMYTNAIDAWESAVKADEFDHQPNEKGKVKPKFCADTQNRYKTFGVIFAQGGQYFYNLKNNEQAIRLWKAYVNMRETSVYKDMAEKDFPKEPFFNDIVYYCSFLSYQMKNYKDAEIYAQKLLECDPSRKSDAENILVYAKRDNCKTAADSAEFKKFLMEQHKADLSNDRYFNLLIDMHQHDAPAAKEAWIDEEIALNPQNKMAYALKGEAKMNSEKWDEAVAAFKKALEIDPNWVQCIFNTGICYNSKAIALNDQLMDKKTMGLSKENAEKVKVVLRDALSYMEKTRELDPNQEMTHWAYPLYRLYYSLGNKEKMAELEALDPSLKQ